MPFSLCFFYHFALLKLMNTWIGSNGSIGKFCSIWFNIRKSNLMDINKTGWKLIDLPDMYQIYFLFVFFEKVKCYFRVHDKLQSCCFVKIDFFVVVICKMLINLAMYLKMNALYCTIHMCSLWLLLCEYLFYTSNLSSVPKKGASF